MPANNNAGTATECRGYTRRCSRLTLLRRVVMPANNNAGTATECRGYTRRCSRLTLLRRVVMPANNNAGTATECRGYTRRCSRLTLLRRVVMPANNNAGTATECRGYTRRCSRLTLLRRVDLLVATNPSFLDLLTKQTMRRLFPCRRKKNIPSVPLGSSFLPTCAPFISSPLTRLNDGGSYQTKKFTELL